MKDEEFERLTECVHGTSLSEDCSICAEDPRANLPGGGGGRCIKSATGQETPHEIRRATEAIMQESLPADEPEGEKQ